MMEPLRRHEHFISTEFRSHWSHDKAANHRTLFHQNKLEIDRLGGRLLRPVDRVASSNPRNRMSTKNDPEALSKAIRDIENNSDVTDKAQAFFNKANDFWDSADLKYSLLFR